jgi:hypothetical protein
MRRIFVLLGVIGVLLVTAVGASAQAAMTLTDWHALWAEFLASTAVSVFNPTKRPPEMGTYKDSFSSQRTTTTLSLFWAWGWGVANLDEPVPIERYLIALAWNLYQRGWYSLELVTVLETRVTALEKTAATTASSTAPPSVAAFNALVARVAALEQRPTTTSTSNTSADLSQLWAAVNILDRRVASLERTVGSIPSQFDLSFDVDNLKWEVRRLWDAVNQLSH